MLPYSPDWDLRTVPNDALRGEVKRRYKALMKQAKALGAPVQPKTPGRPTVDHNCRCGQVLNARRWRMHKCEFKASTGDHKPPPSEG